MLAGIAEDLVRAALADHPRHRIITLLAISVTHLDRPSELQLELPLGSPTNNVGRTLRKGPGR